MNRPTALRLVLSGLSPSALEKWLAEIRRVAALQGREALDATDNLLWSAAQAITAGEGAGEREEDYEWERHVLQEQLDRLAETCTRLRQAQLQPASLEFFEATALRVAAERLGELVTVGVRKGFAAKIMAAREEAAAVAAAVEAICHANVLRTAATQMIHNATAVQGIVGAVDRSTTALTEAGSLTPELAAIARQAKERAARYRAQKKLDEAEVAAAGGSEKRADKLRREAAAVLAQDWGRAFPGEQATAL